MISTLQYEHERMNDMIEEFAAGIVASVQAKQLLLAKQKEKIPLDRIVENVIRAIKADLKRQSSYLLDEEEHRIRRRVWQLLGS